MHALRLNDTLATLRMTIIDNKIKKKQKKKNKWKDFISRVPADS